MQIDERVVDGVTILDLKGKMTLGEGDELLKDKINSLIQQDRKKLLLEPRGRALHRQRGPRRNRAHVHDRQPAGGQAEAAQPDEADPGSPGDHEAADGVRDVRLRTGRHQELHQLAGARARHATTPRQMARHSIPDIIERAEPRLRRASASRRGRWPLSLVLSLRPSQWTKNLIVFAALLFGQRRRAARSSIRRPSRRRRRVRRSSARSRASSISSTTSPIARPIGIHPLKRSSADRLGRRVAGAGRVGDGRGARRSPRSAAAFWLRPAFGLARRRLRRRCSRSTPGPLKHVVIIDVLTIAIGFVLRAAAGAVVDRRADQPLAADPDDPAGAVPGAQQAPPRAGAAGRRRDQPSADPRGIQPVSARPDDLGRHGVDAGRRTSIYTVSPETVQKFHTD